ncbi:hypothetical protein F5Y18DRAFT_306611 [Xylariaceae sp. FL1019]|nr:hypothetical protein F5Y18DRAFT_306611 [Xylariaceae sp. FL1019]
MQDNVQIVLIGFLLPFIAVLGWFLYAGMLAFSVVFTLLNFDCILTGPWRFPFTNWEVQVPTQFGGRRFGGRAGSRARSESGSRAGSRGDSRGGRGGGDGRDNVNGDGRNGENANDTKTWVLVHRPRNPQVPHGTPPGRPRPSRDNGHSVNDRGRSQHSQKNGHSVNDRGRSQPSQKNGHSANAPEHRQPSGENGHSSDPSKHSFHTAKSQSPPSSATAGISRSPPQDRQPSNDLSGNSRPRGNSGTTEEVDRHSDDRHPDEKHYDFGQVDDTGYWEGEFEWECLGPWKWKWIKLAALRDEIKRDEINRGRPKFRKNMGNVDEGKGDRKRKRVKRDGLFRDESDEESGGAQV